MYNWQPPPWQNWGYPPPTSGVVYVPVNTEGKKHKYGKAKLSLRGIEEQIKTLEGLKELMKDKKKEDKKSEGPDWGAFFKAWGLCTFFLPWYSAAFYVLFKHFFM